MSAGQCRVARADGEFGIDDHNLLNQPRIAADLRGPGSLLGPGRCDERDQPGRFQVHRRQELGYFATEGSTYEWNAELNGGRADEIRTGAPTGRIVFQRKAVPARPLKGCP